jgi:ubiquinone/menaquinone biosynthesis C-methylase UbiE
MAKQGFEMSGSAAANYERNNVPQTFGPWAQVLVDRSGVKSGDRVLDVACGTGVVARAAALVAGPNANVVGSDLNPEMLAEAANHVPDGHRIEWRQGDATSLSFDDAAFDVVFCQQALQYIPDRERAATEMSRVLSTDGVAVVSVWRSLEHNPVQRTVSDCVGTHLSPDDGAFFGKAFSAELDDPDLWVNLFTSAGFSWVAVELVVLARDARTRLTGPLAAPPIAGKVSAMNRAAYEAMVTEMEAALEPWIVEGRLEAPTASNVIVAHK